MKLKFRTTRLVPRLRIAKFALLTMLGFLSVDLYAQSIDQVRWKTEGQVETILGSPKRKTTPVGTHASYTLWEYDGFTVAFANNRAFHLFQKDSLRQLKLGENRE